MGRKIKQGQETYPEKWKRKRKEQEIRRKKTFPINAKEDGRNKKR